MYPLSQIYVTVLCYHLFRRSLSSINVDGLGGCFSRCHEQSLPQSRDPQNDQRTTCEGVLVAVHSADEHVVEAGC